MFTIYATETCTYCKQAKALLEERGLRYEYIILTPDNIEDFRVKSYNSKTVPQVFYDDGQHPERWIGGFDKLKLFVDEWWPV